jgi:hypothetical protein
MKEFQMKHKLIKSFRPHFPFLFLLPKRKQTQMIGISESKYQDAVFHSEEFGWNISRVNQEIDFWL